MDLRDMLYSKKTLGVDIDDVMIDFNRNALPYINSLFSHKIGREIEYSDMVANHCEELKIIANAGISQKEFWEAFKAMEKDNHIQNIMPRPGCLNSLKKLNTIREIRFVTARNNNYYTDAEKMTYDWSNNVDRKYRFKIAPIIFSSKKHEVLDDHSIETFMEDNIFNAERLLHHGSNIILFNNYTNMLNKNDEKKLDHETYSKKRETIEKIESYDNLVRVDTWRDVLKHLDWKNLIDYM